MPNSEPLISVIIPHLNQPLALEACLASLESQTFERARFEIIVVDNGSDNSIEPIISKHRGVRLLTEQTPGPGPARNSGVYASNGSILAFIDADCRAHPQWLQIASEAMLDAPRKIILGGDVQIERNSAAEDSAVEAFERVFGFRIKMYIERHGYSGTGNLVVQRIDFDSIGPFAGISVAEDMDWGERACCLGFGFRYVPNLIVYHPARVSVRELQVKWDRNIAHDLRAARRKNYWPVYWLVRSFAVFFSPLPDSLRVLFSEQIDGAKARLGAIGVLVQIRTYRAAKMVLALASSDAAVVWNRDKENSPPAPTNSEAERGGLK